MCSKLKSSQAVYLFLILVLLVSSFTSCVSPKKIVYFNNLPDTISGENPLVLEVTKYKEPVIQKADFLAITIQTMSQSSGNTPITTNTVGAFNPLNAFVVDQNGNIELSLIGFVKVEGLTTSEARQLIKERAKEYFKEPVVNVRISNFDIFVLGQASSGRINIPAEKINILELLATAGDIPLTGKRTNVLLIRTEGDTKKFVRMDLTSSDIFKHPYFYLRQRDMIYVEPNRFQIQTSDNRITRNIGIISSIMSALLVFISLRNIKL